MFISNAANYILVILDISLVFRGRYQMLHQYNQTSWWRAYNARNMCRIV